MHSPVGGGPSLVTRSVVVLSLCASGAVWAGAPAATEWPQWRGPDRTGITTDTSWTTQWPGGKPKQLWQKDIGQGYSAWVVSGNKAYNLGNTGGQDTVWCVDADSGQEVWKYSYRCGTDNQYPGPRATPAVDSGKVYTYSREGLLLCLDAAKGAVVWQKDTRQELGARIPRWGLSSSPTVHGEVVIVNPGAPNASVVAFNKTTGQVVWKSGSDGAGYSSAVLFPAGAPTAVAMFSATGLVGLSLQNGQQIFQSPWKTSYEVNASDPIVVGDKIFITSGYGTGCALVQVGAGGAKQLWTNKTIASHTTGPVYYEGHIYGMDGQMGKQSLKCLDFATGQQKWVQQGLGGSVIVVSGKLVVFSDKGELAIADANPANFTPAARVSIHSGTCWTSPAFSSGRIFVRNKEGQAAAYDLRGK